MTDESDIKTYLIEKNTYEKLHLENLENLSKVKDILEIKLEIINIKRNIEITENIIKKMEKGGIYAHIKHDNTIKSIKRYTSFGISNLINANINLIVGYVLEKEKKLEIIEMIFNNLLKIKEEIND